MKEILWGLSKFLIFVLDICNVVVAYASRLIINSIEHVASLCQINDCEGIWLRHKIIILEFFRRNKISELIV